MDTRLAGAGFAMGVAMVLLLPTFNALNNSYLTDVPPPPWMPTPDEPPDINPPTEYEPPRDMTPPTGWEPPPGYEGPVPPSCPPPKVVRLNETVSRRTISPTQDEWSAAFQVPKYTMALVGFVNFSDWQAQRVYATLDVPEGGEDWEKRADGTFLGTVESTKWEYNSTRSQQPPPSGGYVLDYGAQTGFSGTVTTEFYAVLPCGGLLQ